MEAQNNDPNGQPSADPGDRVVGLERAQDHYDNMTPEDIQDEYEAEKRLEDGDTWYMEMLENQDFAQDDELSNGGYEIL